VVGATGNPVGRLSDVMKDVGLSDSDRAHWSEAAADGLLRLDLPTDAFFHPEPLDAPRAALIFSIDDRELFRLPPDTHLSNLLKERLGGADVDWTREAPRTWPRLRSLTVRPGAGSGRGLFRWLSRQRLPALRELVAASCELTSEVFHALLRASFWPNLEHVVLSNNALGPGRAPWPATMAIRRLAVDNVQADDVALAALFASSLPALEELDVSGNPVDVDGLAALVAAPLPALRSLSARGTAFRHRPIWDVLIGVAGARALAAASLPDLEAIDLSVNGFGDEGLRALVSAPWWSRVRRISLINVGLTDGALELLARCPPQAAVALDLGARSFTDEALTRLRASLSPNTRLG
jgi:hypothetical protein